MIRWDANTADADLWLAVRNGEKTAYNLLFNRYWGRMYQTANNMLNDEEASETIVHDVFLTLWLKREELQINHFRNYIISATRYHVYRVLKSKKVFQVVEAEEHMAVVGNAAEERIAEQSFHRQLHASLSNLPKRSKEIFLLSREEQLSNQEIAERLNISKRSVENQITHALQHLRLYLKQLLMAGIMLISLEGFVYCFHMLNTL